MITAGMKIKRIVLNRGVLAGLLFMVLVAPPVMHEGLVVSFPYRLAAEPGFAPQTGSRAYFTSSNGSEPSAEKPATMPISVLSYLLSVVLTDVMISPSRQANLPANHRQQYLVPIFNSSYT